MRLVPDPRRTGVGRLNVNLCAIPSSRITPSSHLTVSRENPRLDATLKQYLN